MNEKICVVPAPHSVAISADYTSGDVVFQTCISPKIPKEGYQLSIRKNSVFLYAADAAGLFYGEKTLEQLRYQFSDHLPCMEIEDAPAYLYRSFHIDCARHFVPMDELKRMADTAASFKLNKFHWHFSDDQGWRIESKAFPRLHEVGAKRKGDHMGIGNTDDEEHLFYTQAEVRELAAFCEERNIEIVPEVDIPGHVTAMLAAYPELSCTEKAMDTATTVGIFPDILCPGKEKTFHFLFALLDELCSLFPGKYFHIGGDETPKTSWNACPHCRARMKAEKLQDTRQLQGWMTNTIAAHIRKNGKRTIVWNEAALGGNLDSDIIVQVWNDDPKDPSLKALSQEKDEHGNPTGPNQGISAKLLQKGHDLIISNMLGSYCDYPHAYINTRMVYDWPIIPQKCENLQPEAQRHILGMECLIWTEHIRDEATLERLAWPRFAAKAERAWLGQNALNYADYAKRMKQLYPFLKGKVPGATAPKGWKPGPIRSLIEMLAFLKNYSQKDKAGYQDAQSKV